MVKLGMPIVEQPGTMTGPGPIQKGAGRLNGIARCCALVDQDGRQRRQSYPDGWSGNGSAEPEEKDCCSIDPVVTG